MATRISSSSASRSITPRFHAENLGRVSVEATARIEAGAEDGVGHGSTPLQLVAHCPVAMRDGIGFRRYADDRLEDAMKVIGTETDLSRQLIELGRRCRRLDEPAGFRDLRRVLIAQRPRIRLASFAGSEARGFCSLACCVKANILPQRVARWARGSAVDACRCHGGDELAVAGRVARENRGPTGVVDSLGRCGSRPRWPLWCLRGLHHAQEHRALARQLHPDPCFQTAGICRGRTGFRPSFRPRFSIARGPGQADRRSSSCRS